MKFFHRDGPQTGTKKAIVKGYEMSVKKFKLAMGQMLVRTGEPSENLKKAGQMIKEAAEKNCRLIVFPECLDIGWTNPDAKTLAKPIPGKFSGRLCRAAKKADIFVVAGLTEKDGEKIYNAAILISPQGKILLKHRKINELTIAHNIYSTGQSLVVVDTALGKIAVNICADNFPDNLAIGHSLARMGAQMLLSPSAWAVKANHDNEKIPADAIWLESYTTLAKLYGMTVVGVSNVGRIEAGPWKGRICIGNSLAVGPRGKILARGRYGVDAEELVVLTAEILPRSFAGTAVAAMLKKKGYEGP